MGGALQTPICPQSASNPQLKHSGTNLEKSQALEMMGHVEKSGADWSTETGNQFLREFGGLIFSQPVGNPSGGFAIQRVRLGLPGAPSSLGGKKLDL